MHLKLRRPVTVPAGIRPQSIYDAIKEVNLAATTDKRTSFYLPLDAIKQLHISSTTTVSEVIQGLLKKFMVVDNPQKFALFKRIHKDGQGIGVGAPPQKPPSCGPPNSQGLGEEWPAPAPVRPGHQCAAGLWPMHAELGAGCSSCPPCAPHPICDFRKPTPRLPPPNLE